MSSVAQIPYWMYGVLVVLGWNEAMAVLFNPLYFTMLLLFAASAYVVSLQGCDVLLTKFCRWIIIQLGLTGPLFQVTKTVTGEVSTVVL